MPISVIEIPNSVNALSRASVMQIVRSVMKMTRIPDTVEIRFKGPGDAIALPGSTVDADPDAKPRLTTTSNITVEVTEDYDESRGISTPVYQTEYPPFFIDKALGVMIRPVYQRVQTSISVVYTARDRTSAMAWRNQIKAVSNLANFEQIHRVACNIPIPIKFMFILHEIHRLREATAPYGENLATYLSNHFDPAWTVVNDMAGENGVFSIRHEQVNVEGWFDFTVMPPQPDKKDDAGAFNISFEYKFSWDMCQEMIMFYPIQVHNQLLSDQYIMSSTTYDPYMEKTTDSVMTHLIKLFGIRNSSLKPGQTVSGLSFPPFDDWLPTYTANNEKHMLRLLTQLDLSDPKYLGSLYELPDCALDPSALRYIRVNPKSLTQHGESVFKLNLYEGYNLLDPSYLLINQRLEISFIEDLDPRKVYHLVLSLNIDLKQLTPPAIKVLAAEGTFTLTLLRQLLPSILPYPDSGLVSVKTLLEFGFITIQIVNAAGQVVTISLPKYDPTVVFDVKNIIDVVFMPRQNPDGSLSIPQLTTTLTIVSNLINKDPTYSPPIANTALGTLQTTNPYAPPTMDGQTSPSPLFDGLNRSPRILYGFIHVTGS